MGREVSQLKNPRIKDLTKYEEDLLVKFLVKQPEDIVNEFLLFVIDVDYSLTTGDFVPGNSKIEKFLARKEFNKYRDNTMKNINQ